MRIFLFLCVILAAFLMAAPTTADKIKDSQSSLNEATQRAAAINKKLEDLATSIISQESQITKTAKQIADLAAEVKTLQNIARTANAELATLNRQSASLKSTQADLQSRMIKLIAQEFSLDLITPAGEAQSELGIISAEIARLLATNTQKELAGLAKDYNDATAQINDKSSQIASTQAKLDEFKQKSNELQRLQNSQKASLTQLKNDRIAYEKRLNDIQNQQAQMRQTLQNLQIIAKQEEENAKKPPASAPKTAANEAKIRQVGSSYQSSKVRRYTGPKTIAPLDKYSVKQKFGDFVDPIYNIKIFNESVVLRSDEPNARVKSVLGGKVVFAKNTPLLDNVVIVQNEGGMHTIYANLSQIAPGITPGFKVTKGYIIGRVARDLSFEVTQQNYHINPLELIASK